MRRHGFGGLCAGLALLCAGCGADPDHGLESLAGYIVFLRNHQPPSTQVWAARPDGTFLQQLTSWTTHTVNAVDVAPDGRRFAVLRQPITGGPNELAIVRLDDGSVTPVPLPLDATTVRWSPDGSRFLLTCFDLAPPPPGVAGDAVCRVNEDGSGFTRLTNVPANTGVPSWSPDGLRIAYVSSQDGGGTEIYAANQDGSDAIRLTDNGLDENAPVWSPDGARLAFSRGLRIVTMEVNGGGELTLSDTDGFDYAPAWSPDGGTIAFVTDRFAGPSGPAQTVALMAADGSNVRPLIPATGFVMVSPAWGPAQE